MTTPRGKVSRLKEDTYEEGSNITRFLKKREEERKKELRKVHNGWVNKNLGPQIASLTTGFDFSTDEIKGVPEQIKKDEQAELEAKNKVASNKQNRVVESYTKGYLEEKAKELKGIDNSFAVKYLNKDKNKARLENGFDAKLLIAIRNRNQTNPNQRLIDGIIERQEQRREEIEATKMRIAKK